MALIDTRKNAVLFKYGGTPTASDVVNIEDYVLVAPDIKSNEYKELDGELGNTKSYIDDEHTTASFSIKAKLRGNDKSGAAPDTPPAINDLLLASGLVGAATDLDNDGTNDSYTYTVNQGVVTPSTAIVYVDGKKRVVDGIVNNFTLSADVGTCAIAEFNSSGYTDIDEISEANPDVTLDSESLMIMNKISSVKVNGVTANVKNFNFSLNNDIQDIYAVDLAQFERVDFDAKISLTLYRDSADTIWSELSAQTPVSVEIVLGSGAGKTVTLKIDSAMPTDISENDDSGKLGATREFRCIKDAASGEHFELIWS